MATKKQACDNNCPIGIFDSGLGGLTVQKELNTQLPLENTVYFGDNGRSPYGTKSKETIIHFAKQDAKFLLEKGIKMLVIACNTASAHAYTALKEFCDVPVVEVVNPGAKAALKATKNGIIGVIGTAATVESDVYLNAIIANTKVLNNCCEIKVHQKACPLFVGLAEEGWWDNEVAYAAAKKYLQPLRDKGVDTLVLGCTHYPLLHKVIQEVMGEDVTLINSAGEVAKEITKILQSQNLINNGEQQGPIEKLFFTSDSVEKFKDLGSVFLGLEIQNASKVDIEKY